MSAIANKIFPKSVTNNFAGHKLALYVFGFVVIFTIVRSFIHILAPDGGAQSIAGIPLTTFSTEAQSAVIFMFAVWGLSQMLMGIVYAIVLWKYKSLIPLMYIMIFLEYLLRIVIGHFKPVETLHTAPGEIGNYILIPLAVVMCYLATRDRPGKPGTPSHK